MKSGKTKPVKPVKRGVKSATGLPSKSAGKKAVKTSMRKAASSGNVASFRGFLEFYLTKTRLSPKKKQLLESLVRERGKRL